MDDRVYPVSACNFFFSVAVMVIDSVLVNLELLLAYGPCLKLFFIAEKAYDATRKTPNSRESFFVNHVILCKNSKRVRYDLQKFQKQFLKEHANSYALI